MHVYIYYICIYMCVYKYITFLICASFSALVTSLHLLRKCYEKKTIFTISWKPTSLISLSYLLYDICAAILASFKLSSTRPLVGRDLSVTTPHMLSSFFLFIGLTNYFFLLTGFLKSYLWEKVNPSLLGAIERNFPAPLYAWTI
jgi:hypothetical protein